MVQVDEQPSSSSVLPSERASLALGCLVPGPQATVHSVLAEKPGTVQQPPATKGQLRLQVREGAAPVQQGARRVPPALKTLLRKTLDEWTADGIIEPLTS